MLTFEQRNDAIDLIIFGLQHENPVLPIESIDYSYVDWTLIFEAIPSGMREDMWNLIPDAEQSAVLGELRHDVRQQTLQKMSAKQLMTLAKNSSSDQIIDFIDYLPEKLQRGILKRLSAKDQDQVVSTIAYNEDQVGRYVRHDALVVYDDVTVADVLVDLKNLDDNFHQDQIYVIDKDDTLLGSVEMHRLAILPRKSLINKVMNTEIDTLDATLDPYEAADILKSSEEYHLPITDLDGKLLGIFSHKEAMSLSQQQFEEQLAHLGNVSDEDLFAPVLKSSKSRAVWLGINLITAFMAAGVIGLFEGVIAEVVALAVLMPIVASMGGIAGSQTLTLTIRGLATGQLSQSNTSALGQKEVLVSLINGTLWALAVAAASFFWFGNPVLAAIIAFAILANMLIAAFSGITIPVLLDKLGIDPALAGSVILTTVTDVAGFFIFLGLATWLLL